MRLSCPCASDRMSLLHKHLVDRTAWRQKNQTSGQPRVFSLPALAAAGRLEASEPNRASLFILRRNRFLFTRNQNILLVWHAEETSSRSDGQMCTCFALSRPFQESCVSSKRQRTAAWKPKQNVRRSELFQSCGISALMYSARFVCVRVCVH